MPYIDDDEPPGTGYHGARPGVSVEDLAAAADGTSGYGTGDAWMDAGDPGPVSWAMDEPEPLPWLGGPRWWAPGAVFTLPGWAGPRWHGRPRLTRGLGGMLRGARRVGTLRQGWPVYRGRAGGRSWRVVGRPRGRHGELEIVGLHPEVQGEEEMFPIDSGPYSGPGFVRPDPSRGLRGRKLSRRLGWRLRLPHAGVHRILSRLPPEQVRRLAGGPVAADPAPALVNAVARLARRARPAGRLSGGFTVFATPGWRLLVRPLGELQGEVVSVRPVEGEEEVIADKQPGYRRGVPGKPGKEYRVRGAQAEVAWAAPVPLAQASSMKPSAAAVYVILDGGRPIYLGESGNWGVRWRGRLQVLREFGIPHERFQVALGTIAWKGPAPAPPPDLVRKDVEHILVRAYRNAKVTLNNILSTAEILPAPAGFRVQNVGTLPPGLPGLVVDRGQNTPFELGGDPLGRG